MKILLIEDNDNDAVMVKRYLREAHEFELKHVINLEQALNCLTQERFDLVLTDLGLSDSQGLETVYQVIANAKQSPVIVLTGTYKDGELANKSLQMGVQDYLVKDNLNSRWCRLAILNAIERKKMEIFKNDFISTVSHELRTPLAIISMGLENLQAGILGPLSEKQMAVLERNIWNAKRLGKLIDNLLDLSRLESGMTKIEVKEVDLKPLIHEVVKNFQPAEKEENVKVCEEVVVHLPHVECDSDLIMQVLTNLLSNAIRYAKEKIVVKVSVMDGAIQVSVVNDGPGIPQEKLTHIFEKFVQLSRDNEHSSYKGTGLGLAISKEIIEQHKGKIWVESDGKKGVEFYFTLPLSPSPSTGEGRGEGDRGDRK